MHTLHFPSDPCLLHGIGFIASLVHVSSTDLDFADIFILY